MLKQCPRCGSDLWLEADVKSQAETDRRIKALEQELEVLKQSNLRQLQQSVELALEALRTKKEKAETPTYDQTCCPRCNSGPIQGNLVFPNYACGSGRNLVSGQFDQSLGCALTQACELIRRALRIIEFGPLYQDLVAFLEQRNKREAEN